MAARPNIMVVMCDQLSALATSPYGNHEVQTPHLQSLADRGVVFAQNYCNSPLCAPSRASLMSGRMPSTIPVNDNGEEMPASVPTFAHLLRSSGYLTVLSGKMHFVGPDQLHGFEERLTTDVYPSDFGWAVSWPAQGVPPRKFGYGDLPQAPEPPMAEMITQAGPIASSYQHDYDEDVHFHALERLRHLSRRSGAQAQQPWFLCVSYTQPHDPYNPLQEYWDRYEGVDISLPDAPPEGLAPHAADVWVNSWHGVDRTHITDEDIQRTRRGYYGMISYIDDKLGELVKELDRLDMSDDTIVVFTSDHGDMVGEHGMYFKRTVREWSSRVPLVMAGPGVSAHRHVDTPTALVDLFPTVLGLAGVEVATEPISSVLDGESLLPLLQGTELDAGRTVVLESNGEGTIKPIRAVVGRGHKYIYVHGEEPQLYDLRADPGEWRNIAGREESRDVQAELEEVCFAGFDPEETERRVLESQGRRIILRAALNTGEYMSWDHAPLRDAARMYIRAHHPSLWNQSSPRVHDPNSGGR